MNRSTFTKCMQIMSKGYRKWYPFDMTYYDDIFEVASDNFGLITTAQAREMGIGKQELSKLAARGKLDRIGHGVYRVKHHVPEPLDAYADAVALTGPGSYVLGESVLAMHGLASVNPDVITVGTPNRVRKSLPEYVEVVRRPKGDRVEIHDGIPSMAVADAIRLCRGRVMPERLREAVRDAADDGLIPRKEIPLLEMELA